MPLRESTIDAWNLAIEDGLEFRREYGREDQWARVEAMFFHADKSQAENVGPNIILGTGDALLSELSVPNPQFVLKALQMGLLQSTPVLEGLLNNFIYALGLREEISLAAVHAYLFGRGIVKIGYDSEFGYCPDSDLGREVNQYFGITLSQFDKKGSRIEFNSKVEPGMPWVKAVLPHDFLLPYGARDIDTAPWCAHRVVRHIDDVKADPKYENKRDLEPQMSMADYVRSYTTVMKPFRMGKAQQATGRREPSDKVEFVELWEIHDKRTGRVKVLAQGHDRFLRDDVDLLQEDGLPFAAMGFVPQSRTFWVTPDAVYLRASQDEAIDIATMQRKQRRMSLLRFLYEEGSIDNDELERFMSGEIGVGVKYKNRGGQNAPVTAMNPANNNNQLATEAEWVRRDARESVGFSRNQMGEYESTGRRTATEAQVVNENSNQRLGRRQLAVADLYCNIGRKLAKMVFKFWKTPRVIEILGEDGANQWMQFVGSDLRGEYRYQVGFSSEPVEGKKSRQQGAMQNLQAIIQTLQFANTDPSIDPIAVRRFLARQFNDPEINSIFRPGVLPYGNNAALPMQQLQPGMGGGGQDNRGAQNGAPSRPGVQQLSPGQRPPGGPAGGRPSGADEGVGQ